MADELLKFKFQMVNERSNLLQMKQQSGGEITNEEIAAFEVLRDEFLANEVAKNFLEAQQQMSKMQDQILRFFDGLELAEPGLVQLHRWRPGLAAPAHGQQAAGYCGLARKP